MWGVYDYHRGGVCGRVYVYQRGVYVYQGPIVTAGAMEAFSTNTQLVMELCLQKAKFSVVLENCRWSPLMDIW
jgi:hypothetical protein